MSTVLIYQGPVPRVTVPLGNGRQVTVERGAEILVPPNLAESLLAQGTFVPKATKRAAEERSTPDPREATVASGSGSVEDAATESESSEPAGESPAPRSRRRSDG